jgi:hypothetical protein
MQNDESERQPREHVMAQQVRFLHTVVGCLAVLLLAGCIPSVTNPPAATAESEPAAPEPAAAAEVEPAGDEAEAPAPAPRQPQGFSKVEWKLVDRNAALQENPDLIEVENRIDATDPLMAATQSYFTLGSRAQLSAFKHSINLYKAQHDKNPPFGEFEQMLKQANVSLQGLYPWQVYAYDDQTGELCILEDRAEKRRLHEERGLPAPD